MSLLRLIGCDESGGDIDGDESYAQCAYRLVAQNNRHMDSRHMDSNGRTGADSIRKDNNSGSSEKRSIRPEIQN